MDYDDIARTVRERRRALGLTQDDTATLANIDRRTLSELENSRGARGMTLRSLLTIAEVLGLDVSIRPRTPGEPRD